MSLKFDAVTHEYRLDGETLPSVTQILDLAGHVDHQHFNSYSRALGEAAHAAIHYCSDGDLDERSVGPAVRPYLAAWKNFVRDSKFQVREKELRLASRKHGFAGTLDYFGKLNAWRAVIDIKTGSVPGWIGWQLAGYHLLLKENGFNPTARFSLQLKNNGDYRLRQCRGKLDFAEFFEALGIAKEKLNGART